MEGARKLAASLGFEFYFDWEGCRSSEGFYKIKGDVDFCARRACSYLNFCDLAWMETDKPNLKVAKRFSDLVHVRHPTKMLAYNLSPSFNWSTSGLSDKEIADFVFDIGKLGFTW